MSAGARAPRNDEQEEDDDAAMPVGASFFGEAGTATPLRGAMQSEPALRGSDRDDRNDNWEPVRRRVEPPRTKSVFRSPEEEYDDEEGGFARGARIISSILSFGLYAALAGAAVLIFWNLRVGETNHPSATKIEASASVPKAPALSPSAPRRPRGGSPRHALDAARPDPTRRRLAHAADRQRRRSRPADRAGIVRLAARPATAERRARPRRRNHPALPRCPRRKPASSSVEPAGDLTGQGLTGPVMPFPMTVAMAAERAPAKPSDPRRHPKTGNTEARHAETGRPAPAGRYRHVTLFCAV